MIEDLLARLAAPFPPSSVSWRIGALSPDKARGMALAYVDARDVQDRLDEACGALWQCKHHHCGGNLLACEIGIKIDDEWVWRGDGAGPTDVEGDKGAFSDSFKRAGVRWGIARYLYEIDSPWVDLEKRGSFAVIPEREKARLRSLLSKAPASVEAPQRPPQRPAAPSQSPATGGLREISQRIHHALEIADIPERIDGILRANQAALREIETLGPKTYAALMAFAGSRRSELIANPRATQSEDELLMGQP